MATDKKIQEIRMSQEKENRQHENAQSVQEGQQPHKRRVRYKGRYPKKFEEKYKELQPEKYQDTIQHVMQKGNTPAGMHISIMVKEIIDFLEIKPGQIGFDATLGYGGHTKAMLQCLQGQGHMYATDVDHEEAAKTKKRLEDLGFGEDILTIKLQNFCTIDEIAKEVGGFDFLLADLGVSSMQIDNPKRGFSFKADGPLDLRLNQEAGISAAERLEHITRDELAGMLYENSDEPYCEELAKAITDEIRKGNHMDTTTKLRQVIEKTLDFLPEKEKKETIKKTCQRTFQALRIDVNREFEVLYEFMEKLPGALKPGGRAAILTFHSGEDKLVKKALKADEEKVIEAQTIIIATGAAAKYLGLEDEKKYAGMGVSACATCDGFFYRKKVVAVVGGGDTACEEASYLAGLASKVYLIVRKPFLRASKIMQERVMKDEKIEVLFEHNAVGLYGDNGVEGVHLVKRMGESDEERYDLAIDGFFLAIGHKPNSDIFKPYVDTDETGYILTEPGTPRTKVPGVFAAGDVADPHYRQAITAAATGCMAAIEAERFLLN